MSEIMCGNWNEMKWRPLRAGMKQVTLAMGADDCTVTVGLLMAGHAKRPHTHPEEQITVCLSGECDYMVDGVVYRLKPGSFITVPGGLEHYIEVKDTDIPCMCMDIFGTPRPAFKESYLAFLKEAEEKK